MKVSAVLRKRKSPDSLRDSKVYIRVFVKCGDVIRVATPLMVRAEYWDENIPGYKLDTPFDQICQEEQELVNLHIKRVLKIINSRLHDGINSAWVMKVLDEYEFRTVDSVLPTISRGKFGISSTQVCHCDTPTVNAGVPLSKQSDIQYKTKSDTPKMKSSTPKSHKKAVSDTPGTQSDTPKCATGTPVVKKSITDAEAVNPMLRPKGYGAHHINKSESELQYEAMMEAAAEDNTLLLTECFEQYLEESNFNGWHHQALSSVLHRLYRYEKWLGYKTHDTEFRLYLEEFDKEQIEDFSDYMMNEYKYYAAEPEFYAQFNIRNPKWIREISKNSAICSIKRLNMFLNWAVRKDLLHDKSFRQMTCDQQIYGTPYFLTLEERDRVAALNLVNTPRLEYHRNKFIFQCHVGCRLGDLNLFTWDHINGNFLEYIPHKNLLRGRTTLIRVPLTEQAKEILMDTDPDAHYLFHNYEDEIYRLDIKEILRKAGVDREVMIYNSVQETSEKKKLYEVGASHLARRTFIGNLYKEVKDPALIASLTGHTETSTSFSRYRTIDDDVKRDILKLIE